jgi:hypothetical protein
MKAAAAEKTGPAAGRDPQQDRIWERRGHNDFPGLQRLHNDDNTQDDERRRRLAAVPGSGASAVAISLTAQPQSDSEEFRTAPRT